MSASDRLRRLRQIMHQRKLAAYLVPSTDPHQSEYVPPCWQRRAFISGFTGSAGDVVITASGGGLWTDGRYFLQAEDELRGSGLKLYRMGDKGVPSVDEFLHDLLRPGKAVGVDPRLLSLQRAASVVERVEEGGGKVRFLSRNLVDQVWKDQPEPSPAPIEILSKRFAGETVASKAKRIRAQMHSVGAHAHVLTTLDAIAWLCNVRGRDVDFNPVAIAYAIVTTRSIDLFLRPEKATPALRKRLRPHVRVRPYDEFATAARALAKRRRTVWVDEGTTSRWVMDLLRGANLVLTASPVSLMKAKKNATEMAGMRACHVRDGVAMVRFLKWLEESVPRGGVTEISAADRLEGLRAEQEHYRGLSFGTISGYAEHGAIIHYSVSAETDVPLRARGIYLVDSGGQYLDGTTDITRTVLLGKKATRQQKDRFTRVLKGHIALARVRFPEGTRGMRLDTLARLPLWEAGLDYNHGTGHGVGSYLNVHEGPQSISPGRCTGVPIEAGNVQSNEPGYYQPGAYGIRLENLILAARDESLSRNGTLFLKFETLTQCPIDTRLVEPVLLSEAEREWLNDYHRTVARTLGPCLAASERRWLKRACMPI